MKISGSNTGMCREERLQLIRGNIGEKLLEKPENSRK